MRLAVLAACALALLAALPPGARADDAAHPDWSRMEATRLADDLEGPVDIALAPDGALWYIEVYGGNVVRLDAATGERRVVHHVDSVAAFDERGLVGFALDPDFERTRAFYLYYTAPDPGNASGGENRLSKVVDGAETVLLRIPAFEEHNGGRIVFAPDRSMFVGVGENQLRDPAQDLDSNLGKILHLDRDGRPAPGNVRGYVHSYGHRNPYGLAVDWATGALWETENSGWRRDEVNIVERGGNYGYPECEGFGLNGVDPPCPRDKGYEFPILTFYEDHAAAPTGATFFLGQFYWLSWNEGSVHHAWRAANGTWMDRVVWNPEGRGFTDIEVGPDGRSLYVANWTGLWRLEFPGLPAGVEKGHLPPWWKGPRADAPAIIPDGNGPGLVPGATAERPVPGPGLAVALGALGALALAGRRRR